MSRIRNQILPLLFLLTLAFAACATPEIRAPESGYGDARIPEAVKATEEARALIDEYRATYGPAQQYGMIVETNVDIPMRDGSVLKGNIFRPDADGEFPVIMSMTAYMKDRPWPVPEGHEASPGKYQVWELPNPERWVPWGYALVRIDTRGFGQSTGKVSALNDQEANDYYDAIEWAARQPWSNGNIGLSGVSYIAINQWYVAAKQPPSLKAIIPWEGLADQYRDSFFRGGIFSFTFVTFYMTEFYRDYTVRGWPHAQSLERSDMPCISDFMLHRLDDEFWSDRRPDWSKVRVPLYSAGNWNGWMGAGHLRGNLEGFKRSASEHKKLRVHTGDHQDAYYSEEGFFDQLRFFDYWLKGLDNGIMDEPPVKLAIRNSTDRFDFEWRYENEWPIARTQYRKLYLSATGDGGSLMAEPPVEESSVTYDAPGGYKEGDNVALFVSEPFGEDTEITGEIKLNLWVSSTIDDMNVHATMIIVQPTLHPLLHKWYGDREVVTVGWLSAQHRELDPDLTTESRPYHRHKKLLPLDPGKPTEIQVEIWPTSMVYRKGSRLVLALSSDHPMTMQGSMVGLYRARHAKDTIHTGGRYNSYLQIPVVPPKE
ncbi:MAG: CocE/NonD family hydrolase [Candidatus Abyssubacteria bacterium]